MQNLKKKEINKIYMLGNKSVNHKFELKVLWKMYTITECVLTLAPYTCPQVVVLWLQSGVPDQTPYHQGCISSQVNFHSVQILFHRIHHTGLLPSLNKKIISLWKIDIKCKFEHQQLNYLYNATRYSFLLYIRLTMKTLIG